MAHAGDFIWKTHRGDKKTSRKEGRGRQFDIRPRETGVKRPALLPGSAVRSSSLGLRPNRYQASPPPPSNSLPVTVSKLRQLKSSHPHLSARRLILKTTFVRNTPPNCFLCGRKQRAPPCSYCQLPALRSCVCTTVGYSRAL